MKNVGLLKAITLTRNAGKMSVEQRELIQQWRLKELVNYARKNSPYFAGLYKDVGSDFSLAELPPTGKAELMEHYNDWVTDREVSIEKIKAFMENTDNVGRKMGGKYLVYTTSGSTGNPVVVLYNDTAMNVASAINVLRSFARSEDMKAFTKKGGRSIGLFADNGFYLGCGSIRYNQRKMPWKKKQLMAYDVRNSQVDIVDALNRFKPAMIGSYPTALELLIDEKKSGRLKASPVIIMTGGEYLSEETRERLSEAFSCYVQTNYSCTEGGTVACECPETHLHKCVLIYAKVQARAKRRTVRGGALSARFHSLFQWV